MITSDIIVDTSKSPYHISSNNTQVVTNNTNIEIDKDIIIKCGDFSITASELFKKLKVLDKIIKDKYPEYIFES